MVATRSQISLGGRLGGRAFEYGARRCGVVEPAV